MSPFYRKALLLAAGIAVAGGTAAYLQSRKSSRRSDSFGHYNGDTDDRQSEAIVRTSNIVKENRQKKKGGFRSLHVLAAIILSRMGQLGARDLLVLVTTVVRFPFCCVFHFLSTI